MGINGIYLTRRQQQVLEGIAEGLTYKQIALRIGIKQHSTISSHVRSIKKRLGAENQMQMGMFAIQKGLIDCSFLKGGKNEN